MPPLRILTWHVHGSYLLYLSRIRHEIYLPVKADGTPGYGGRAGSFPWPENVHEVPADEVQQQSFDCILFQSRRNYLEDQFELLSAAQRHLPRIYLEHDPPLESPTNSRHVVDDPDVLLVHVTAFNDLMWDSGRTPTRVIEHGVEIPGDIRYSGEIARGLVAINNLERRGRRLGVDIFERVRDEVPLDLIGMEAESLGGLGEVPPPGLAQFAAHYRFFFNPIRFTSLGLAVIEAMMAGVPIVGLATTEMVTVIRNGVSGFLDTNFCTLIPRMRELIEDTGKARRMGEAAKRDALERFHISRFARDWEDAFAQVTCRPSRASEVRHGAARQALPGGSFQESTGAELLPRPQGQTVGQ